MMNHMNLFQIVSESVALISVSDLTIYFLAYTQSAVFHE